MYSWEKSLREEKSRKYTKNPSFSSSLLDEIYRSIDGNDEKSDQDLKFYKERSSTTSAKKYSQSNKSSIGGRAKSSSTVEDEEMASLRRACLIEKWMEKKVNDKVSSQRKTSTSTLQASQLDNDPLFFSSSSTSSDSSSGGLSSSDTEFFATAKSRKSCFASSRPKPIKTSVSPRFGQKKDEFFMQSNDKSEENMIKSESRALKIYANLKKVKQPISPGGRLTTFINSLFTAANGKKSKNFCSNDGGYEDASIERKSKSSTQAASACSSASSFSRSCLSKTSPNSRMKLNDGAKRTVRFYPVSVIVDEDCRPCGHKRISDQDSDKFGRPSLSQNAAEPRRKTEGTCARDNLKANQNQKKEAFVVDRRMICHNNIRNDDEDEEDYDDEDAASDCSSDLFEIDHLALFGNNRFREELPVYETTHLDTNKAIANGLIR